MPKQRLFFLLILGFLLNGCQSFHQETDALLAETGVEYQILSRQGGMSERKLYCDLAISPSEVKKLAQALGLSSAAANASTPSRFVILSATETFDTPSFAKQVDSAFGRQAWMPVRHGFAGAFLLWDPQSNQARLWLSIAAG
jgi:hypothetical protein